RRGAAAQIVAPAVPTWSAHPLPSVTDTSLPRSPLGAPPPVRHVLTPGEERFEAIRQRLGFVLAPLAFVVILLLPMGGMKPEAHRLAAVMAAVVILWITEALPMPATALLGAAAAVVMRVAPAKEVFAPFADPLIFLFIGSFIIARAIFLHGLDRRMAYGVLGMRWIAGRPSRVLLAFGAVTATLSAWMSNTATTAMMFGIGMSILSVMMAGAGDGRPTVDPRYATGLMLMTSFAASIGGLATPVGTPPNVIGIGFIRGLLKQEITFFEWMAIGVPVVVLLFICLYLYLNALSPAGVTTLADSAGVIGRARAELGAWTPGQRSVMIAFAVTAVLWITPGLFALTLGENSALYRAMSARLPESAAALIGALLLFILPGNDGARAITWDDAARIDWGVILLYGGGFALGVLSFQTGLAESVGRGLTGIIPLHGEFGLLVASVIVAVMVSETTSNTASANMVVPVVISIALAQGVDPLLPALGATMAASLGFMLPVSTPCNAIVYGSGYVPLMRMVRYGIILDLIGIVVITAAVWLLAPLVR
ncbi:MAG TPA: DASS family sodium-coupled anion symporter, partial [Longimicrobium sp.]|uniref:SLC13 family permease n=1 Tax=Longimicrobium sp. TaxID=2029185 RepID=UPI002ED8CFD2